MKQKNYNPFLILAAGCCILSACSKMDEYKKFTGDKEISYTGKADSVIAYSGKNRINLSWLRSSDPKVAKTRIYWKNRTDSVEVPLNNSVPGSRRLNAIINNLPEGSYNFELFNFDNLGNTSVVSRVSGVAYGATFQQSLLNRGIESFYARQFNIGYNAAVQWFASAEKSIGVEVSYMDSAGVTRKVIGDPKLSSTHLPKYDERNPISYRTMFLPDSTAIDTFYTAAASKTVNTLLPNQVHIKNPGNPFIAEKMVGRWGTLADWITTTPVKNHDGGVGGIDNLNTSTQRLLSFEFWGTPAIVNGKVYQTGSLPAGSYRLVVTTENINNNLENSYISVAKGSILPDVANISQSVVNLKFINNMSNKDLTLSFTLTQFELISLGVVSTMQQVNESSLRIRSFKLFKD
ncbi:MAG: DUF5013 domain-containing protein [Ferruginibacter sp.]|nr:DUF5013 domain-containing protein [Ferruginibacter sp.]